MTKIKYSIIVSCYNEEQNIEDYYNAITPAMQGLGETYEIIMVNDGSTDNTQLELQKIADKDKHIKVITLSRNFSQQNAFDCALRVCKGDAVITMDVDLQDPIDVVLQMIDKWKEGFEVVHGKRLKRKGESIFKRFSAWLYVRIINKLTHMHVPTEVGEFKLYDRKVVDALNNCKEHNRFIRNLSVWVGFKQTTISFDRPKRNKGTTKYNFKKLFKLSINGLLPYSYAPLYWAFTCGLALNILSIAAFIVFTIFACINPLPLLAWVFPTITMVGGIILTHMGIANAYTARIYDEVLDRPNYIISSTINID